MGRRLPPLNALRAFEVAARTRNFTAAARELRVSQGAVSRHIAQLEAHLGLTLFHRAPHEVRLTPAGQSYAATIRAAFDSVEQATSSLVETRQPQAMRIRLFPTVAIKWLVTRLAEFHADHPGIDVQLTTTPSLVQFDPVEDDFTIQIGTLPQPGIRHDALITIALLPVCAPAYLRRSGPFEQPEALLHQPLLSSVRRLRDWRFWFEAAGITSAQVPTGSTFGNSALAYQAAIDGMGVAIAQKELVRDDLAQGRLVPAYPLDVVNGETYYLASKTEPHAPANAAVFRDWLLARGTMRRAMEGARI